MAELVEGLLLSFHFFKEGSIGQQMLVYKRPSNKFVVSIAESVVTVGELKGVY